MPKVKQKKPKKSGGNGSGLGLAVLIMGALPALLFFRSPSASLQPSPVANTPDVQLRGERAFVPLRVVADTHGGRREAVEQRSPARAVLDPIDGHRDREHDPKHRDPENRHPELRMDAPPPELASRYRPLFDPLGIRDEAHRRQRQLDEMPPTSPEVVTPEAPLANKPPSTWTANPSPVRSLPIHSSDLSQPEESEQIVGSQLGDPHNNQPARRPVPPASNGPSSFEIASAEKPTTDRNRQDDDRRSVKEEDREPRYHRINDGDSLPALAARYLGDASRADEIFRANADLLESPSLLPLGVKIRIPWRDQ